jgi:putative Mg2+ transporter-C (MgtC) family protein
VPIPAQTLAQELELLLRLVLAVLLGGLLGLERELGRHSAGLRTHVLVTLGAAAYTIAGTYGVAGLGTVQDAGRVAAQIVTGVGFLGAGTIWRNSQPGERGVIYGLTTAASIWVAAAVGMACGFGLYFLGTACAVLGFLVLRADEPMDRILRTWFGRRPPAGRPVPSGQRHRRPLPRVSRSAPAPVEDGSPSGTPSASPSGTPSAPDGRGRSDP